MSHCMRTRRVALAALAAVLAIRMVGSAAIARTPKIEELYGVWELVSSAVVDSDGRALPSSDVLDVGAVCIMRDGTTVAILAHKDRSRRAKGGIKKADFHAMYGRYTYKDGMFIYIPSVSAWPDMENVAYSQSLELHGEVLMMRRAAHGGLAVISTWRRP